MPPPITLPPFPATLPNLGTFGTAAAVPQVWTSFDGQRMTALLYASAAPVVVPAAAGFIRIFDLVDWLDVSAYRWGFLECHVNTQAAGDNIGGVRLTYGAAMIGGGTGGTLDWNERSAAGAPPFGNTYQVTLSPTVAATSFVRVPLAQQANLAAAANANFVNPLSPPILPLCRIDAAVGLTNPALNGSLNPMFVAATFIK